LTPFEQRAQAILRRVQPGMVIAEIGVFHGQLSECLLNAGLTVHMIDNWLPGSEHPERYKATGDYHTKLTADAVKNAEQDTRRRAHAFPGRAWIHKMDSIDASKLVEDKSLDMVFLDADHSKAGVKEDIHYWRPKVIPGGWIGGHDYGDERFGVTEAVIESFPPWYEIESDINLTWFVKI